MQFFLGDLPLPLGFQKGHFVITSVRYPHNVIMLERYHQKNEIYYNYDSDKVWFDLAGTVRS